MGLKQLKRTAKDYISRPVVFALGFAAACLIVISFAKGAGLLTSFEAESGAGSHVQTVTQPGASGGRAVQFGNGSDIKPFLSGLMDRGNDWQTCFEAAGVTAANVTSCYTQEVQNASYLNAQTFLISWKHIEPARGQYNWGLIDAALQAISARGKGARLRVTTGVYSPDWAKRLGGSPVPFFNANTLEGGDHTAPRYWTPEYKDAWNEFMTAAAARYDGDARLNEVETCLAGLQACEEFLIYGNEKTTDGVTNGRHLYDAGFNDAVHMQAISDDLTHMTAVWKHTRIHFTVQPFHNLGNCSTPQSQCGDSGGDETVTFAYIDGSKAAIVASDAHGGTVPVSINGLQTIAANRAVFFHTGLGPKEIGGVMQPQPDANTVKLYDYLLNAHGARNAANRSYVVALQTETLKRLDTDWVRALDYACTIGGVSVELPHGYGQYQNAQGAWAFSYPSNVTLNAGQAVLEQANLCYQHNATLK